jgi:branched-chain amino acid transport system permease protein
MSRSPPDRVRATLGSGAEWVRRWVAQGDGRLLLLVTVSIYALFTAFSLALGFDADGTANTLRRMTFFAAVYAMLVLALNLQWGYAGLFNIGVAGFMAVGVYTMAILTRGAAETPGGLGLPLPPRTR